MTVDWEKTRYEMCLDGTWTNPHKNAYERGWVLYLCLQRFVQVCEEYGHVEDFTKWQRWPESDYHHWLARLCDRVGIPAHAARSTHVMCTSDAVGFSKE